MKGPAILYTLEVATIVLGAWLLIQNSSSPRDVNKNYVAADLDDSLINSQFFKSNDERHLNSRVDTRAYEGVRVTNTIQHAITNQSIIAGVKEVQTTQAQWLADSYIRAWQSMNRVEIASLWKKISVCETCIKQLVKVILDGNLENHLLLEVAIKMIPLKTPAVLPVFNSILDPANNTAAVIFSEKLIEDGRPEYVLKLFEVMQVAEQNGYEVFSKQLTWVVSKLDNPLGINPILDIITGRIKSSPGYAEHVTKVFRVAVQNKSRNDLFAQVMSDYYLATDPLGREELWGIVQQHPKTLLALGLKASQRGQNRDVDRYAHAISELPNIHAIEGMMILTNQTNNMSNYFTNPIQNAVKRSPDHEVLHLLEEYLLDLSMSTETRILAAEGLLSVKDNAQAKNILKTVMNNSDYEDIELLSYISGRI